MKNPYFFNGLGYSLDADSTSVSPNEYYPYEDISPRPINQNIANYSFTGTSPTPTPTKPTVVVTNNTLSATMILKTIVSDSVGILPLATVKVNNDKFSTTENGVFQKTNVNPDDLVTISYVGYKTFTAKASDVPAKVILMEDAEQLQEVVIKQPKKTNWLVWLGVAAVTAVVANEVMKEPKKPKTVIAKI